MHGYVFYPDGGARPQREHNGAGIHGYRWDLAAGTRSIGHSYATVTARGYSAKSDSADWMSKNKELASLSLSEKRQVIDKYATCKVTPTHFYDCVAPFAFGGTNNTAELKATCVILNYALNNLDLNEATSLVIRQDAMYVVEGINERLAVWMSRNFIRKDGTEVPNAQIWKKLFELVEAVRATGVKFSIEWVEAHSKDIGNNSADQLATAAVFKAKETKLQEDHLDYEFKVTQDIEYWAGGLEDRHPLMFMRYCFMQAGDEGNVNGDNIDYIFSSQGKETSLNGKRTSDDGYGVVRTKKQPLLEAVRAKHEQVKREVDYYYQIDVDSAHGAAYRYLNLYGNDILHRKHEHVRHLFVGDAPVSEELHPPFLAGTIYNNALMLSDLLDNYKDQDAKTLCLTDITDTIYDVAEKDVKVGKGKEPRKELVCTLKPSIGTGYSSHKVKVSYKAGQESEQCEITLRCGVDFPERSCLKRCEDQHPRVYVVTNWLGGAFMYATVVESGDDLAIWSGINASLRVIGAK